MQQNSMKYKYEQVDKYKESIELKHLITKTFLVNVINLLFAGMVAYFFWRLNIPTRNILGIEFLFLIMLMINLFLFAFVDDLYNNLKISMYINTIFEYAIATTLILMFRTPSIFTTLFLAYAITAIYQDNKVMLISNGSIFIIGLLLSINFSDIFVIPGNSTIQNMYIIIYLFLFILLLTLSSYILIKRKSFFYNHLAKIKELESRNIDLLIDLEEQFDEKVLEPKNYYNDLLKFSEEISKKIGIENVFKRKIELLSDMDKLSQQELLDKYSEYTIDQIRSMENMKIGIHKKMHHIGIKSSKMKDIQILKKEAFSDSQFKSFKHFTDDKYVKILAFVTFYVMLKIDKPYLKQLEEEKIKDILMNSEYYYLIDPEILEVYFNNNEVFDTIVNDILKESNGYAPLN
jgi:hypothetical protein